MSKLIQNHLIFGYELITHINWHTGKNKYYLSYVDGIRHPQKNHKIKISKQTWLNMSFNKTGLQYITWVKERGKLCFYWVCEGLLKLHHSDIKRRWWCWWIHHLTTYCMKSEVEIFRYYHPMVIKNTNNM